MKRELEKGKKEQKKLKTPSITKFFPRTSHVQGNKTGIPVGNNTYVGNNQVGEVGVGGNYENNDKQQDPEAKNTCVSYENTDCVGGQLYSKGNIQQQLVVQQIAGSNTEIYRTGYVGETKTGLDGKTGRTEQLQGESIK